MKCLQNGYCVMERPTHEYRRKGGASKIDVMRVAHLYVWNLICGLVGRCNQQGVEIGGRRCILAGDPNSPGEGPAAEMRRRHEEAEHRAKR